MSFRISIGDIHMISGLAYRIGKTLTTGRKSAPGEFSEVQNQLFAISNALKLLSATLQQEGVPNTEGAVGPEEDEILSRMIENCQTTLQHLDGVLKSYPELRTEIDKEHDDETAHKRWRTQFKENIKKIKWTAEGADLDKLRQNLATHVNALNLAIAARGCIQTDRMKAQVDLVHGMLGEIHERYLNNLKNVPATSGRSKAANSGSAGYCTSSKQNCYVLRAHASSVASVATMMTLTIPALKIRLCINEAQDIADFKRFVAQLALVQGLKASSITGASSMLMYTSVRGDGCGYLSVLNTQGDTADFRQDIRSITITSNELRYIVESIDSVQMLHYMMMMFPHPSEVTEQENLGFLPCRNAEIVLHTKSTMDDSDNGDITQLIVQFDHLTVVDEIGHTLGVLLKGVTGKVYLGNNEHLDIHQADIELTFTSREAAASCWSSVNSLQRYLFLSYLQYQRLEEITSFRSNIGDVMIRDMQLLDAQATVVQDPTTNEQRMIVSSKCGSKFVTMILSSASSGSLLVDGSGTASNLPAYFIDINTERTRVIEQ
ncbi:uncharacterized protein K444DRAFT_631391 [Hyaloscypha bicolor E]|uniref:Fungal N-terminal domain-containing protein n=1 Tax=Hyaloscypha bicolor E TaxID=1095630 RepID=A0A2J6T4T0_9HELO|nr:uncharacterized protein K444DRAFT_631391 [Hyaloscypha bicolor E]PMD58031.1 hypothetical protein K444DRAFT_631391 [Hyaloscypha bicolor E]